MNHDLKRKAHAEFCDWAATYDAHWLNHFLFDANDYARQVWPRDAALTLLMLISIWGPLNWPSIRKVFREND